VKIDSTLSMAAQARAFLEAFETLDNSMFQISEVGGMRFRLPVPDRIPITVPAVTCIAFAAEIAIKTLIVQAAAGNIAACPRDHDLFRLFARLPATTRAAIASALPAISVEEKLRVNAGAFERWRYSYESEAHADEVFLREFVRATLAQVRI
jgi:hypothetical protein